MRFFDDRKIRSICIRMLFLPILHVPLAIIGSMIRFSGRPSEWAGIARVVGLIISAYGVFAPLLLGAILHKSGDELMARGINPHACGALVGVASSTFPMVCGLALTFLGEGIAYQHAGFIISVMGMAYWSWRERVFLFSSDSSALRTKGEQ